MGLPTGEVQTGAITLLRGEVTLQGLLGNPPNPPAGVFDQGSTPPDQPCPYLEVFPGTTQKGQLLSFGKDASDVYLQVTGFTKAGGFLQARAIMKQVYNLLDGHPLVLSGGFTDVLLNFENEQELFDPDQGKEQIVHRYLVATQG